MLSAKCTFFFFFTYLNKNKFKNITKNPNVLWKKSAFYKEYSENILDKTQIFVI